MLPQLPRNSLSALRKEFVHRRQRIAMKTSTSALELRHQANYLELASHTDWLDCPPISSPGGTASYSLLYVLLSLLRSRDFTRILEFGVGQSSKLISAYVDGTPGTTSMHIEHDKAWLDMAVPYSPEIQLVYAPLVKTKVFDKEVQWYSAERPESQFDLLLVDGPPAWSRETRFNRHGILNWIPEILADDFVLVFDDAARVGERKATAAVKRILSETGREVLSADFVGGSSQTVFATPKFRYAVYL